MVGEALLWKLKTRQQFEDDVTDDHCKLTPKESLLSASSISRKTQGCYAPLYKSKTVFTRLPFTHKSIKCTSTELSLKKNKQPEPTSHQISEFGFTFPEQRCDRSGLWLSPHSSLLTPFQSKKRATLQLTRVTMMLTTINCLPLNFSK